MQRVKVGCAATPAIPGDVVSGSETLYDGAATWTANPALTKGDPTKVLTLKSYSGTTPNYVTTATTTYESTYGRVTSVTDAVGHQTTTSDTQNTAGLTSSQTVTTGAGTTTPQATTTTFDVNRGLPLTVTDPNNKVTTTTYDAMGRLTGVWLPGRATTATASRTFGYTLGNATAPSLVSAGELRNNGTYTTAYGYYDGMLRPVETQTPAADLTTGTRIVTQTLYDSRGLTASTLGPVKATGAPGTGLVNADNGALPARTDFTYDGDSRQLTSTMRAGIGTYHYYPTVTAYDGPTTTVTPPSGGTATATVTDSRDQVITRRQYTTTSGTAGAYQDTTYAYDANGNPTAMTDPAGNSWTRGYDLMGRRTTSTDPDAGTSATSYNDDGTIATTTDSTGSTLAFVYDPLGRKIEEHTGSSAGPKTASWLYDTIVKGQLTSSTTYDAAGDAYIRAVTGYNNLYQPTGTNLSIPGSETGLSGTYTTTETYNLDGGVRTYVQPTIAGVAAVGQGPGYDSLGHPYSLNGGSSGLVAGTSYSAYGEVGLLTEGVATSSIYTAYSYEDGTRRLLNRQVTRDKGTGYLENESFTRDDAGKLTSVVDSPTDPGAGTTSDTQCFGYDPLGHLTLAWTPGSGGCAQTPAAGLLGGPAPYWQSWTWDNATGNRTTQTSTTTAGDTTTTSYAYPAAQARQPHTVSQASTTGAASSSTTYGWDAAGNEKSISTGSATTTLTWDAHERLTGTSGPTGTTSNVYDADGNLLIARDAGGATLYADQGPFGSTEIRYATTSATASLVHHY
ncbi:RHS repeat domain-containing protein [Monashia sp. NPDC004114]